MAIGCNGKGNALAEEKAHALCEQFHIHMKDHKRKAHALCEQFRIHVKGSH